MNRSFVSAFLLALLFSPLRSEAYIPPAFYVYTHIAEQRANNPQPSLQVSVSRPLGSGTEEILGSLTLPTWESQPGGWPSLSILFANNPEALFQAVTEFGIPVAKETDLMRANKDQISAMKDPPKPFYKPDKRMKLKRYRQTYAWVHQESSKSVWVEKDTFLPLKLEGPCPEGVVELDWAKSGENKCELEFRNVLSLRRGSPQNSRLALWKDGAPVLFFSFDRVIHPKAGSAQVVAAASSLPPEIEAIAKLFLH